MVTRAIVALVSGGGSGLGAAVARRVVASGGRVLISDLSPAGAELAGAGLASAARLNEHW